jgi:hypothetical protein
MILSMLLALACATQDDVQKLKAEVERLKAELAVRDQALEALRKSAKPEDPYALRRTVTLPKVEPAPVVVPAPSTPGIFPHAHEARITAVAHEIGLVVISLGSDEGVVEGAAVTLYRGSDFVAKAVVDRTDRKWSAAKISVKKMDARVGDIASFDPAPRAPKVVAPPADELRSLRKELDEVRKQVRALSDTLVPAWQGPGVALEEAPAELRAHLGIARGVLVRRVREGSAAEKAGLRANDLIPDLLEAQVLQAIESKAPLRVLRQGRELTIGR